MSLVCLEVLFSVELFDVSVHQSLVSDFDVESPSQAELCECQWTGCSERDWIPHSGQLQIQ